MSEMGKGRLRDDLEGYFSLSSSLMSKMPVTRRRVGRRTMPNPRAVTPDAAGGTRETSPRDVRLSASDLLLFPLLFSSFTTVYDVSPTMGIDQGWMCVP